MKYPRLLLIVATLFIGMGAASIAAAQSQPDPYQVIRQYPHDSNAFTQGLIYENGTLYESTGLYGASSLRKVDLITGAVITKVDVPAQYFAEGMTLFQGKIFQLTWQSHVGFIYDPATFAQIGQFSYTGEGWGLTHDSQHLIMSDGTNQIRFLDPTTFQTVRTINVTDLQGNPLTRINELEYINGEIFANVWQTNLIVRIDPATGTFLGWLDLAALLPGGSSPDVLNGIAYDNVTQHLLVTGKRWAYLYELELASNSSAQILNASFEIPALGSGYQYNPSGVGVGWAFSGNSGIKGNNSAFGGPPAPNGTQAAFIQMLGSMAQSVSLNAGSYTLSFQAARRGSQIQPVKVTVDGAQIGSLVSPPSTSFSSFSIPFSVTTTGAHTIAFTGTDPNDKTTFIDAVILSNTSGGASTTTLASSLNPSIVGTSVTFTGTVIGLNPTGSVNFKDGAGSIAGCSAVALVGSGNSRTAACTTNALTAAVHSLVATYSGDAGNATSSSTALSQTVNKVTSTTGIGSSLTPSTMGTSVTFTATVSGFAPTGTVNFKDGAASIAACSAVALTGSGNIRTATCATSSLSVGTHSISAVYSGDASNNGSTSTALSQVVNSGAGSSLVNPSFEIPALGSGYQYNPNGVGVGWTFSGNSGIKGNNSAFGGPPAPNGTQAAFIQMLGSMAQSVSLNVGSYTLSFQAARRGTQIQPVKVTVDGVQIGSLVSPPGTAYTVYTIPFSVTTSGAHTLSFAGTVATDKTTFIDSVSVQ